MSEVWSGCLTPATGREPGARRQKSTHILHPLRKIQVTKKPGGSAKTDRALLWDCSRNLQWPFGAVHLPFRPTQAAGGNENESWLVLSSYVKRNKKIFVSTRATFVEPPADEHCAPFSSAYSGRRKLGMVQPKLRRSKITHAISQLMCVAQHNLADPAVVRTSRERDAHALSNGRRPSPPPSDRRMRLLAAGWAVDRPTCAAATLRFHTRLPPCAHLCRDFRVLDRGLWRRRPGPWPW